MLEQLGINAKKASANLAGASTELKNKALEAIANALVDNAQKIIDANKVDYNAQLGILDGGMLDRLMLDFDRIKGMADGCIQVMKLDDPCGRVLETVERPNGLVIKKVSCPMGVIGIIYKTKSGLAFRSVGEFPRAAETLGINITKKKYLACSVNGALCGLAGAYLTTIYISSYVNGIVSGRGYIALAAVIFGKWKPKGVLLACIFFAFLDALQLRLQVVSNAIPYQFLQMLPYLATLIVLSFFMKPGSEPKANGKPYTRESR